MFPPSPAFSSSSKPGKSPRWSEWHQHPERRAAGTETDIRMSREQTGSNLAASHVYLSNHKSSVLTSFSISSSSEISSSFSSFFLSFFSTKPGGRACRYIQVSAPPGHTQNQPYLLFSMASRKYLHTCGRHDTTGKIMWVKEERRGNRGKQTASCVRNVFSWMNLKFEWVSCGSKCLGTNTHKHSVPNLIHGSPRRLYSPWIWFSPQSLCHLLTSTFFSHLIYMCRKWLICSAWRFFSQDRKTTNLCPSKFFRLQMFFINYQSLACRHYSSSE